MKGKTATRRAMLLSLTSLLICAAMLVGTTFAWFTDSVTSGTNRIIAGNLDVELYHKNSTTPEEAVTNTTLLFNSSVDASHLWEPGAMSYETFKVANVGSLALKYALTMQNSGNNTVHGTTDSLLDVLKVAVIEGEPATLTRAAIAEAASDWYLLKDFVGTNTTTGFSANLYPASDTAEGHDHEKTFTVVLYWPQSENDNTYNLQNGKYASDGTPENIGELWVKLGVTLVATQLTSESDSFDNQYDAATTLPAVAVAASTAITSSDGSEDLIITKTGVIESATVPATAANEVFTEMATSTDPAASYELNMNLNVAKTGETTDTVSGATTVDLDIDMTAVMKTTTTAGTTTSTQNVTSLQDYVTINYNLGAGKTVTGVTHSGAPMEALSLVTDTPTNENGGYFYNAESGILTIKTKSFSPFAVSYKIAATGVTLDASASVEVGKTIALTATVQPANATDKTVTWTSSNTDVATVDANGVVTGVATGTATITATAGDNKSASCNVQVRGPVDLADVDEDLSVDNSIISGSHELLLPAVLSTSAKIVTNNSTMQNIAIQATNNATNGGLTIQGSGNTVANVVINQAGGNGSTLRLTEGNGVYTVTNSTLTHSSADSAGRYGALYFEGATINDQAAAQAAVTTVDHVNIHLYDVDDREAFINTLSVNYNQTKEVIEAVVPENAHDLGNRLGTFARAAGGLVYNTFGGTLNVSNSTIDIPYSALQIGIDAEPRYGWVNVTNSTINTTSMGFERVDYTTFKNVTFKNDWTTGPMQISTGSSYQGNLNYIFEDCNFDVSGLEVFLSSTGEDNVHNPKMRFKNCTINGTVLTEQNYESVIGSFLAFATNQSTYTGQIQNLAYSTETNAITFTVARVAK